MATIGYQHIALVCADAELPPTGFLRTLKTALELDPEIETRCYYGKDECKLFALRAQVARAARFLFLKAASSPLFHLFLGLHFSGNGGRGVPNMPGAGPPACFSASTWCARTALPTPEAPA